MNIVIIDVDTAGLACADGLVFAGHAVTLFDKGRGPGVALHEIPGFATLSRFGCI